MLEQLRLARIQGVFSAAPPKPAPTRLPRLVSISVPSQSQCARQSLKKAS